MDRTIVHDQNIKIFPPHIYCAKYHWYVLNNFGEVEYEGHAATEPEAYRLANDAKVQLLKRHFCTEG